MAHPSLTYPNASAPAVSCTAAVETGAGSLMIRTAPSPAAPCAAHAPDGARLAVYGRCGAWYAVRFDGTEGYVTGEDIVLLYAGSPA